MAGGFSVTREAKQLHKVTKQMARRSLATGLQQLLYRRDSRQMKYVVTSHHMHHLLGVWDDMFDVTHWAMSVGESTN